MHPDTRYPCHSQYRGAGCQVREELTTIEIVHRALPLIELL
jgi:hypothetical protein